MTNDLYDRALYEGAPCESAPCEGAPDAGAPLSDAELLARLIGRPDGATALARADAVLRDCGGLAGLPTITTALLARQGIVGDDAVRLQVAIELGRRLARARIPQRHLLDRPDRVAAYLLLRYGRQSQEVMGAVFLDVRGQLIADVDLFRGTLHRTTVEPRLILKEALIRDATAMVLFHTHPSGDPAPSADDLTFTRRVADAGEVVGVRLVDHLILGNAGCWVSLRRRGTW